MRSAGERSSADSKTSRIRRKSSGVSVPCDGGLPIVFARAGVATAGPLAKLLHVSFSLRPPRDTYGAFLSLSPSGGMFMRNSFTAPRSICLMVAMVAVSGNAAASLQTTVQTKSGPVRGTGTDIVMFKGIPYAAPPTGDRRWRPPAPPEPWTAVRDAAQFGLQCPQPGNFAPPGPRESPRVAVLSSEDCLTLNVWTPAKSASERLP